MRPAPRPPPQSAPGMQHVQPGHACGEEARARVGDHEHERVPHAVRDLLAWERGEHDAWPRAGAVEDCLRCVPLELEFDLAKASEHVLAPDFWDSFVRRCDRERAMVYSLVAVTVRRLELPSSVPSVARLRMWTPEHPKCCADEPREDKRRDLLGAGAQHCLFAPAGGAPSRAGVVLAHGVAPRVVWQLPRPFRTGTYLARQAANAGAGPLKGLGRVRDEDGALCLPLPKLRTDPRTNAPLADPHSHVLVAGLLEHREVYLPGLALGPDRVLKVGHSAVQRFAQHLADDHLSGPCTVLGGAGQSTHIALEPPADGSFLALAEGLAKTKGRNFGLPASIGMDIWVSALPAVPGECAE